MFLLLVAQVLRPAAVTGGPGAADTPPSPLARVGSRVCSFTRLSCKNNTTLLGVGVWVPCQRSSEH